MSLISIFIFGLLFTALCVGGAVLWRDAHDRRLEDRLVQITSVVMDEHSARDLSDMGIRRAQASSGVLINLGTKFLKFSPDNPEANIIPPRLVIVMGVLIGTGATWITNNLLGGVQGVLMGVGIGLLSIRFIYGWEHNRYTHALVRQLPDMIEMLVSGSRAGLTVSASLRNVSREMQSPTREVMSEVIKDVAIGRGVDEALLRVYERTQISEYAIVAVAIGVQTQTGGALAESLQNVAEIVRTRRAIADRASALASELKASAVILVSLPIVSGGALAFIRPGYLNDLFEDPRGQKVLAFAVASLIAGVLTMRWMIKKAISD